ncbi:MAG: Cytosine/purine/uracil/thiamine/allantoin permease family protein [uncultured Nocardioides sp.]|uniref:Cytosine/purine/uracil/thiamine/allantoin permease family protein n=1 Tax=uncultured Nocardioides sp. TaxID=198441 RepID=A0A6J4NIX7_9ACTN|nr:MAG: Cytosine/purine/uracil/thiamine/allantoin permease family protein [uncultured Nocardioides sp.]
MSSATAENKHHDEHAWTGEHSLAPVPDEARTSKASHQFWIWAGANIAPINWVLGALGIYLGLSLADVVLVLVVGNLVGMSVFGFFVLMGQRTGVTQMVLSRSAFGRRGAYLPTAFQFVIATGWCAINTWIVLDLVTSLFGELGINGGNGLKIATVLVIMAFQVFIAAYGFRAIASFEKYTVPVTLVVLLGMTIVAWTRIDIDWSYAGSGLEGTARLSALSTIMTAIGIGWGISWFAYASDYSRFVPRSVPASRLFAASALGQFVPVIWLGVLGATLATVNQDVDPGQLIVNSYGALALPVLLLVIHGPIATNILNIYSASVCALTLDIKVDRKVVAYVVGLFSTIFAVWLVFQEDFAWALDGWLASMVTWVAPWGAVMLVHYYWVARQQIDIPALYDEPGRSRLGDFRWDAIIAFVVGTFATWFFEFGIPAALQGPGAKALGGVDLSWFAGALTASVLYAALARRRRSTATPTPAPQHSSLR